ncbi:hypothetical protein B0G84_7915 [Paraburkholderia sp. BL8N3]|nr:hypothetical protein [Paraburkholderia sp. BL8N3]TCK33635.1 hypothetical protein B0G84_7915 [Paraburkholderia sp. BL8N3]
MRKRGKALEHYAVQKAPGVRGDMIVAQEKSTMLNRYSNIGRFQVSGVNDPQPMPPLHDAVLSWMRSNGFVLTGFEFIGDVVYAQSWWCGPALQEELR